MKLIDILSQAVRNCFKRFPAPSAFATALTLYAITIILFEVTNDQLAGALGYFLSVGLVLSLSLALWSEEQTWTKRVTRVHIISYIILLIDTIYLFYSDVMDSGNGIETLLFHASAIVALVLSVFFISFTRERDDIPSWNFTLHVTMSIIVCYLISLVLFGGLSLLFVSLRWLFSINLGGKWYAITGVLFGGYLPTLLLLGRIPGGERKHDHQPLASPFFAGVIRYLFLPLEALYLIVLYIYAIQIVVNWELPNGQVSWLVIVSFVGMIAIEFGLYPIRRAENRPFDHSVTRLLPLILMPLLVLMTVGIVRRFSDYGITIARLYVATLNGWFYLVCLGLFLSRARRISWIPISFSVLFLLTSALPINYASITRRVLSNKAERALARAGVEQFPIDVERYDMLMRTLSPEEQTYISSKLSYLQLTYDEKAIEPLVVENKKGYHFYDYIHDKEKFEADSVIVEATSERVVFYNNARNNHLNIPEGFSKLYTDVSCENFTCDATHDTLEVQVSSSEVSATVLISIEAMERYHEAMDDIIPLPTHSPDTIFLMDHFFFSGEMSDNKGSSWINLQGHLITK